MAVFSKFAVSVAVVAVGYEEGHCETASALQMKEADFHQANEQGIAQNYGDGTKFLGGFQNFEVNGRGLQNQIAEQGAGQTPHEGYANYAITVDPNVADAVMAPNNATKSIVLDLDAVVSKALPSSLKGYEGGKLLGLLETIRRDLPVDDETLREYLVEVNSLGLSTQDVLLPDVLLEDMPAGLKGVALRDYIIAKEMEQRTSGKIMKAVRMLQEKICKGSDGMKDGSHPKEARSEIKGGDLFMACLLFICILVVCAGGLCLWAHWLCARMGYAE